MTDKPPPASREDRLKAALRDNLRRRKVQSQAQSQARARISEGMREGVGEEGAGEPPLRPAPDESDRSDGALARFRDEARETGTKHARTGGDGTREYGMMDGGNATELEEKRGEIAALIAHDLGFGEHAALGADQRRIVEAATASMIERSSAIVPDHADPIIADVRLGQLLAEYRNLEQLRIDERETLLAGEGGGREDDA